MNRKELNEKFQKKLHLAFEVVMPIYVFALFLHFHPTVHIVLILASWFVGGVFDLIGFLRSTSDFCPPVHISIARYVV